MGGAMLTPDHPVDHPDASRGWVREDALRAPVALHVDAIFNFVLSGPTRSLVLEAEAGNVLIASTLGQHVPAFPEPEPRPSSSRRRRCQLGRSCRRAAGGSAKGGGSRFIHSLCL